MGCDYYGIITFIFTAFSKKKKKNIFTKILTFKLKIMRLLQYLCKQNVKFFFLVNSNTYQNTHENSNISVLHQVYNTLFNQSITTYILAQLAIYGIYV